MQVVKTPAGKSFRPMGKDWMDKTHNGEYCAWVILILAKGEEWVEEGGLLGVG